MARPPRSADDPPDAPLNPYIGDVLELPADFAGGLCCWIVRLPGHSWTDRSLPFGLGRVDGHTEVVLISAARGGLLSRCSPASMVDVPEPISSFLEAILADPPRVQRCLPPGRHSRHVRPAASSTPRPAPAPSCAGRGRPRPPALPTSFLPLRPMLSASPDVPSHSLAFLAARNHLGPRRRLSAHHRDSRLMREWGVPTLAPPACIVFGRIESGLARRAQRAPSLAPCDPPPSLPDSYIYADGRLPTLATGRSNHPRFLDPPAFLSTQSLLSIFGFRFSDRLARALLRLRPGRAQEAICRGVDLHVSRPLIHLLRTHAQSPLRLVAHWNVALAFTGADTFSAALRAEEQPYTLVCASEPQPFCRRLVLAAHPYLPDAAFPLDAASPAATTEAAASHLTFWGFPCGKSSSLQRGSTTPEELESLLATLSTALLYVKTHAPSVFLLENVPALLGRHRWALDRLLSMLTHPQMPSYVWHWDVLCPTEFGGIASRPRLFLLGWLPLKC